RNVASTVHGQVRVTEQQMASDIIHAAKLLASDPRIGSDKIFHIGWSKGGNAGLAAAIESSIDIPGENGLPVAGYIEFYPYCGFTGDVFSNAKVLILHGSEDNITPLAPCERLVSEMQAAGSEVSLKVFDGAHHGFDNWNSSTIGPYSGITIRDTSDKCTIVFSRQSHSVSADGKHSVGDYQSRIAFLKACGVRGANIGGSPKYRKIVEQTVIDFIEEKEGSTSVSKMDFTGTYRSKLTGRINEKVRTRNPEVRLVQKGHEISGTFGNSEGNIFGKVEGSVINFEWETASSLWSGTGRWTIKPNSSEFVGSWFNSYLGEGNWNLTKVK
ncbi:MAG: prolyl oligopeptidase family serine peptidase, partial [Gammaproteobacteria bacterium]|nr:prolyl oligopeptidase family serine peptidase [Gammaproteobacteria bacterium]